MPRRRQASLMFPSFSANSNMLSLCLAILSFASMFLHLFKSSVMSQMEVRNTIKI